MRSYQKSPPAQNICQIFTVQTMRWFELFKLASILMFFLNWHSFPNHWKIGWNSQQQSHQFHWNLHCVFDSWFSIHSLSWNQSLILNVNSWHLFNQYILSTLKHSKTINCTPLQWKWLPFHIQWCAQYFSKVK